MVWGPRLYKKGKAVKWTFLPMCLLGTQCESLLSVPVNVVSPANVPFLPYWTMFPEIVNQIILPFHKLPWSGILLKQQEIWHRTSIFIPHCVGSAAAVPHRRQGRWREAYLVRWGPSLEMTLTSESECRELDWEGLRPGQGLQIQNSYTENSCKIISCKIIRKRVGLKAKQQLTTKKTTIKNSVSINSRCGPGGESSYVILT